MLSFLTLAPTIAFAQNEMDALRLSMTAPGGTARSTGLANAFGACGADGVSIAINPAGLGLYRTSEISFTPGFDVNGVQSSYLGTSTNATATSGFVGNFTLSLNSPGKQGSPWRSSTFGLVFDRQASHQWDRQVQGFGSPTSILDDFAWQATGIHPAAIYDALPFTSALAYDTYAIDPNADSTAYIVALPEGGRMDQSRTSETHGSTKNTSFFYSANYLDRLYIGISLGIVGYRYNEVTTHAETVVDEEVEMKDLSYRQELDITGNGIDLKAGFLVRLTEQLRAGLAFHGPMWTQLNDTYRTNMVTRFWASQDSSGRTSYSSDSPENLYSYNLNTPWKAVASAAYVAGQYGLVSVDYEYSDYRSARFGSSNKLVDDYDFEQENQAIKASFRAGHTIRLGTEWRHANWYYRLGWAYSSDPFQKDDIRHGLALRTYAGGLGYRTDHVGVDLGVNYSQRTANYFPYDPAFAEPINEKRTSIHTLVTISYRP